MKISNKLKL